MEFQRRNTDDRKTNETRRDESARHDAKFVRSVLRSFIDNRRAMYPSVSFYAKMSVARAFPSSSVLSQENVLDRYPARTNEMTEYTTNASLKLALKRRENQIGLTYITHSQRGEGEERQGRQGSKTLALFPPV